MTPDFKMSSLLSKVKYTRHDFKTDILFSVVRVTVDRTCRVILTRASYQFIEPENQWLQKICRLESEKYVLKIHIKI